MGRKSLVVVPLYVLLTAITAPALAQEQPAAQAAEGAVQWMLVTARFSIALAAAGCAYAQSRALTAACEAVSRNPGATDTIRLFMFLGLTMIEFLALLTMLVIVMKW